MHRIGITKFAQSAFVLENGSNTWAFDLGTEVLPGQVSAMTRPLGVFVSHQHSDHFHQPHLTALGAPVFAPADVAEKLDGSGLCLAELTDGVGVRSGDLYLTPFAVDHGPGLSAPIINLGFDIIINGKRILFLGDMAIPSPVPSGQFDIILVPVGAGKVFTPEQALSFLLALGHKGPVIPVHYSGRANPQSAQIFQQLCPSDIDVRILENGERARI